MNDQDSLGSALRANLGLTVAPPTLDPSFRTRARPGPTRSPPIQTEYIFSLFYCYLYRCIELKSILYLNLRSLCYFSLLISIGL